ncbi:lysophospholipase [Siphonobacter sp. BAB-5385]|uniref:rhamnogalacturonan acetylesterase n=1 Tax=Siphonobacter sp. BAB-5385 TaxID=1864822 RepID=UPI000B9E05A4|nr:rhamnogalacturonan acetylesterase [Siphonobacter sp. BAB-5385]OZI09491.1 lysophospholipase [Siphonobacter sp. BAB-5385]
MTSLKRLCLLFLVAIVALAARPTVRPTLYLIGDSTVKNGSDKGDKGLWGWGHFLPEFFDTTRIHIENHAIGGRSSRTFHTEGRWEKILARLQPGDYVLMQFGHNDAGALDDTARARGTIRGIGDETKDIYNPIQKRPETVHTYGWYMKKYITEAQAKGAIPVVLSLVPRNVWKEGKVARGSQDYGLWAKQVAEQTGARFIDLNEIVAKQYEAIGQERVTKEHFTEIDHTHTSLAGAKLNAAAVVEGVRATKGLKLTRYLIKK